LASGEEEKDKIACKRGGSRTEGEKYELGLYSGTNLGGWNKTCWREEEQKKEIVSMGKRGRLVVVIGKGMKGRHPVSSGVGPGLIRRDHLRECRKGRNLRRVKITG